MGENNSFKWWNYRESKFQSCKLPDSLTNELKYFRIYIEKKYGTLRKVNRISLDGTKISGTFIVQNFSTAIYNRFNRKFSKQLENLKHSPKDIVECSQFVYSEFKEDSSQRKLYQIIMNLT